MATIKAYTDLEQSKKLAIFLPPDSADMEYLTINETESLVGTVPFVKDDSEVENSAYSHTYNRIACWSLAALLNILPESIYDNTDEYSQLEFSKISVAYHDINDGIKVGSIKDNLVDACYELILKLHKLNFL